MPVLVVSKFEPEDLDGHATRRIGKAFAILACVLVVPLAPMTAGTVLLTLHRGAIALPALVLTGAFWLMTLLSIKKLLRPQPIAPDELQRLVTVISPMRIEFDPDRLRVEMPIGRSTYAYDSIAAWEQTADMDFVHLKRGGSFHIPRRFTDSATEADVAAFLRQKGVKTLSR